VAFLIFTPGSLEHNGFRQNESAAAGGLRRINILERGYASAHPDKGFACELPLLRPTESVPDPYNSIETLLGGEWSGYRFALAGCTGGAGKIVTRYQASSRAAGKKWGSSIVYRRIWQAVLQPERVFVPVSCVKAGDA
jgi:hypothetical protein